MSENNVVKQEKKLTKKDVFRSYLIWTFFSHSTYNYERMQATGVLHALAPCLEKLYGKGTPEMKEACKRHMEFFNTEPNLGGCILGMTLAMEEQKANGQDIDPEMISSVKTGLMGPLAGVGDTIWQGTLSPIALGILLGMAQEGNLIAPLLYVIIIAVVLFGEGYWSYMKGYYSGREGITKIISSGLIKTVTEKATIVGSTVLGGLAASYVTVKSGLVLHLSSGTLNLQTDVLDSIFLNLLPLCVTLLTVWMLRKKMNVNAILLILIAIGVVGTLIGFF
ncbi:PTS system mannose/fructose/sorbose family transporter subunit IID [Catenisphaera adipataccumulans]|jgi:mannose/fructose/N-acetylgalactosamine-specific phosphotransferase system component IID|uniref:PTS system mannose-specific IID component n=1 Tax=Catenisphaera adipataccumulans TaxID=700500 RepID=A0A7W8CXR8_9FIRM|nr:PTS system mannose/fructose/sorbose family transporter subunit IID [Catenisphaera adipataccumulans]MBB5183331.1 PTS system mannose-specific IID component [Catenisphaera adipataccumulans]